MVPDLGALSAAGEAKLYPDRLKITVGMATCGRAAGAVQVYDALRQRIALRGLDADPGNDRLHRLLPGGTPGRRAAAQRWPDDVP